MGIHVLPHRAPAGQPVNTSSDICPDCSAVPRREHGIRCPAVTPDPPGLWWRTLAALTVFVLICLALWALAAAVLAGLWQGLLLLIGALS